MAIVIHNGKPTTDVLTCIFTIHGNRGFLFKNEWSRVCKRYPRRKYRGFRFCFFFFSLMVFRPVINCFDCNVDAHSCYN